MASLITRRTAARQFLSVAKSPYSSSSSLPTILISCRFQSTTPGYIPSTTTTTTAVPKPAAYPSATKPAYTPSTPSTPKEVNQAPTAANAFKSGLNDLPPPDLPEEGGIDWARSFSGLSQEPFAKEITDILLAPLQLSDIEIKPDGIIYLPEIKYRRILNLAFGPGGWGLAPRSDTIITNSAVTREYGLVCNGRLVSVARGEQDYFDPSGIPTATEGCKSNALMRCCKDLGIASELWDPRFIRKFKKDMCSELMAEHMLSKKRKKVWVRKGDMIEYPFKQV
ncbi:mitochondrial genome maintenance MGM101 [Terfezia boudieri ATCC MYA-4762]|uniref:Mitochondrial genome maintenance protein MGM101 n=1 Tax=Terfezia boudieri ATCC MYA-4762 TaxID=1051890 RepID=A0A3N4LZL8_9PEZI|nr:mitochondrial genome maintenance MGM101 [Terfezia boudieri ATCC MYA-4762]